MKQSYDTGLYGLGQATAQYAGPGVDPTADLNAWNAALAAGEPYQANPEVQAAITQVGSTFRSPYAVAVPPRSREIPVFVSQGTTDPLFPAIQGLQQVNRLLAADSGYPVWAFYGDLGHAYADNPAALWQQANGLANAWLSAIRNGSRISPRSFVTTTPWLPGQTLQTYAATRFQDIPGRVLHLGSPLTAGTVSGNGPEPEGLQTDPIANSGCRVIASGTDPDVASWTFPVTAATTLVCSPVVHVGVTVNGVDAILAARLWDVDPVAGNQALVSRSVFRLTALSPGTTLPVAFELFANAWQVARGHQLKLELTQDDVPYWRADNLASALCYAGLRLDIPVR